MLPCRFKADETALHKNLAEMDLDDILNKAKEHETVGEANAGATSLGGEGFLHQMAIVSDVKADLSWDDIIPLEDHQKFEEEEQDREREEREAQAAKDSAGRKRAAAMVQPGASEGMEGVDAPPPAPCCKESKEPSADAQNRRTTCHRTQRA